MKRFYVKDGNKYWEILSNQSKEELRKILRSDLKDNEILTEKEIIKKIYWEKEIKKKLEILGVPDKWVKDGFYENA